MASSAASLVIASGRDIAYTPWQTRTISPVRTQGSHHLPRHHGEKLGSGDLASRLLNQVVHEHEVEAAVSGAVRGRSRDNLWMNAPLSARHQTQKPLNPVD